MRQFAVFDIDGTLIRWQLYHALADELAKQKLIDQKSYDHVRQARMSWKQRSGDDSFSEYERTLIEVFDKALESIDFSQFENAAEIVFDRYKDQVYTYTRDLIRRLKENNYLLFAVSGSPDVIVRKMADYYGFDDFAASKYHIKNGKFSGHKDLTVGQKDKLLSELVAKHKAVYKGSWAVGDSEGDIAMLEMAQQPIAFNPSNGLKEAALLNSWPIVIERKNVIYHLSPSEDGYKLA